MGCGKSTRVQSRHRRSGRKAEEVERSQKEATQSGLLHAGEELGEAQAKAALEAGVAAAGG